MDIKKEYILEISTSLFLENGFQRTSIQDIAEVCNMSKATIYKHFQSKEELGIYVTRYLFEQLLLKMQENKNDSRLCYREKLENNIVLQIENTRNRNYFIDALFFCFSPEQREKYLPMINHVKFKGFLSLVEDISYAFPLEKMETSWELGLNLFGIVKEISFLDQGNTIKLDPHRIAAFAVDSLEAVAKQRMGKMPLFTMERIESLKKYFENGGEKFKPISERNQILKKIREEIEKASPQECKEAMTEVLNHLEHEYRKPVPKKYMIDSFCLYLGQYALLKKNIEELNQLNQQERGNIS